MVNNLDKSLLIFNAEGLFVREFCLLPDSHSVAAPSPPPEVHGGKPTTRSLIALVENLLSFPYALGMLTMLEAAYQDTSSNTAEYADFLPAGFGRALCLADFGCSIELAHPPLENQSKQYPQPPEMALESYKFPVGLGNADAGFNGLAGYFNTIRDLQMKDIYSAFGDERSPDSDAPGPHANPVLRSPPSPLELTPYHISALDTVVGFFAAAHQAKLQLRGVILDPMRSLHLYTGGLFPMKEVALPRWAVGSAMKEMHAFFFAGPILVPHLPPPNDMRATTTTANTTAPSSEADQLPLNRSSMVEMPVSGLEDWSWWQARATAVPSSGGGPPVDEVSWSKYPVPAEEGILNLSKGGHDSEFVEGYFIMTRSLKEAATGEK
ncbi:hypothetical protein CDEST_15342 [Colletotrichum destructivum]|uniref:Uncharacterized protein n=1 Tax=Colletotrichum destructivum TaxID=34406 RepID=A0AAX4J417_9PEZI|nr:hypothetical protein CDEST_15342 [Colletotrichum destructivum]